VLKVPPQMQNEKDKRPYFSERGGDYLRNQTFSILGFMIFLLLIAGFVESGLYEWVMSWF
jgi:hypothetical protein